MDRDSTIDAIAREFAAYAESNPRLKELAEKDSNGTATEAEEAEFLRLLNEAEDSFDPFDPTGEDPIDLFGPWWE